MRNRFFWVWKPIFLFNMFYKKFSGFSDPKRASHLFCFVLFCLAIKKEAITWMTDNFNI